MTHCSRPASVQYRGEPTERMRTDPLTGERLALGRKELLTYFTDPDSYVRFSRPTPRYGSAWCTSAVRATGAPT
jgi:hypothetical protein